MAGTVSGISVLTLVVVFGLVFIMCQEMTAQTQDDAASHVLLPDFMVEIKKHNMEREESRKLKIAREKYNRIFKVHSSKTTRNLHDVRTNFDYNPRNIYNLPSEEQEVDEPPIPNETEANYTRNIYSDKWIEIFKSLDDQENKKWTRENKLRFIRAFGHESEQSEKKKFYTERFTRTFNEFVHKSTDVQTSLRSTKSNRFRNAFRRQNEEENKKGNRRDIKIALIDNMKRSLFAAIDEMLDHVEVLHFPHPESIVRGMLNYPDEFHLSEDEVKKLEKAIKAIKAKTLTIDPHVYEIYHHEIYRDFPLWYDNYSHFMDHRDRFFSLRAQNAAASSTQQSRFQRIFSRISLYGQKSLKSRTGCRGARTCRYSAGAAKGVLPDGSINYQAWMHHKHNPIKKLKDTSRGCNKKRLALFEKVYSQGTNCGRGGCAGIIGQLTKGNKIAPCKNIMSNPSGKPSVYAENCAALKHAITQWEIDCQKMKDLDHAANLERCKYPSIDALGPKGGKGWPKEQSIGWELMHSRHAHRAVCPAIFKDKLVDENGRWEASRTCTQQMCEMCLKKVLKCDMSIAEGQKVFQTIYGAYAGMFEIMFMNSKRLRGIPDSQISNMPQQVREWMPKSEDQFNSRWKQFSKDGQGSPLCETLKHIMCTHVMKVCPLVSFLIVHYAYTSSLSNMVANNDCIRREVSWRQA